MLQNVAQCLTLGGLFQMIPPPPKGHEICNLEYVESFVVFVC